MGKKVLTKTEKTIILSLKNGTEIVGNSRNWNAYNNLLEMKLVKTPFKTIDNTIDGELSPQGLRYIELYPKLNNPSIFDDTKWLIGIVATVVSIIISCIMLF